MDLTSYERLVKTENAARKYLLGFCFENHQRFCPRCKGKKLYRLADDRRRCSSCRYTFHDFSGRWSNQGNLAAGQWLRLIKLFELELSIRKIAQQLRLSYNAAYKAVHTIRAAILAHSTIDLASVIEGWTTFREKPLVRWERLPGGRSLSRVSPPRAHGVLPRKPSQWHGPIPSPVAAGIAMNGYDLN